MALYKVIFRINGEQYSSSKLFINLDDARGYKRTIDESLGRNDSKICGLCERNLNKNGKITRVRMSENK